MSRILVVARSHEGHSRSGGMERVTTLVAEQLRKSGNIVDLLTTSSDQSHLKSDAFSSTIELKLTRASRYSLSWWFLSFIWGWRNGRQYDRIVSVSSAGAGIAAAPSLARRMIAHCHGTALTEARSAFYLGASSWPRAIVNLSRVPREVLLYRRMTAVAAVSDKVREELLKMPYGLDAARVKVIPNSVRSDQFGYSSSSRAEVRADRNIEERIAVGIFFGRVEDQKGVDLLIDALAFDPDGRFLFVVGQGAAEPKLREKCAALGLQARVEFLGRMDPYDVPTYLSASDVAFLPSRREEGLPLAMLEALSVGLRVVISELVRAPSDLADFVRVAELKPESISEEWVHGVGFKGRQHVALPKRYQLGNFSTAHVEFVLKLGGACET